MNIYVFEPSKDWLYCGGAVVIVASSFGEAIDLALAYEVEGDRPLSGASFFAKEPSENSKRR